MIADLMWVVTGMSVISTVLNIYKKQVCFIIWLITNSLWCVYDFSIQNYAQAGLFLVYVGLAIWGIWKWRKK
jgi:nicotinamide riboside transporter PnuC